MAVMAGNGDSKSGDNELVWLNQATKAIARVSTIGEAKEISDKAAAIRVLARKQGWSQEQRAEITEIEIRATARMGELLKEIVLPRGKHDRGTRGALPSLPPEVTYKQSSRAQQIASVPAKERERYIAENKAKDKLSVTGLVRLAKERKCEAKRKPIIHDEPITGCVSDLSQLTGKIYGTIYADPPWAYTNHGTRANVRDEYAGTMTPQEIAAMPIGELAADDSHLHLWVTKDFIFEAKQVLDAWGFEYKSMLVWVKTQMGIGNYWRVSHEILLLGVRGDAKRFNERHHKSWMEFPRGEHSAKPEQIRHIIEKVSPGPFLELFGRKPVEGWMVFGNQIGRRLFPA